MLQERLDLTGAVLVDVDTRDLRATTRALRALTEKIDDLHTLAKALLRVTARPLPEGHVLLQDLMKH